MLCACAIRFPATSRQLSILLAASALNLFVVATAHAATYYVATNGNDSNAGSQAQPFKTIQKAVGVVRAGDTVMIGAGRYPAFVLRNINGTSVAPITFKGDPGAIVDRNLSGDNVLRNIEFYGGSYITIDGLELTDSDTGPGPTSCIGVENGAGRGGIKFNSSSAGGPWAHHLILTNLNIHDLRGTAVIGNLDYLQFINNHVYNNGGKGKGWAILPEAYGTYLKGSHIVIRGNVIHGHSGNGIRTGNPPDEYLYDSIIENNISYNNGGTWSHPRGAYGSADFSCEPVTGGDGIVLWYGERNIIRNNVIFGNVGYGIRVHGTNNTVYNNTVYKNQATGLYCYEGENTVVKNNISYLSGRENIFSGCAQSSNNLTTDPKFVNAGAGDFGLQSTSPAIDKGVTLAEVPTDYTGKARPEGAAYDIGAFEGAGSRANVLPGMAGGLPPGAGGGGSAISDPLGLGHCLKY